MRISAVPDPEDQDLDPADPLGSLCIQDEEGSEFLQGCVFLDDWFDGLLSGLRSIRNGQLEAALELYSEGGRLTWKAAETGAIVEYKNYRGQIFRFRIVDLDTFDKEFRKAIVEFTDKYKMPKNWPKCEQLVAMRDWALNNHPG
jgi:hypothetical protein